MTFSPAWKNENVDLLLKALLSIQNEEEACRLLDDLCTIKEIQALAQRMEVADMLAQQVTYNKISAETGASTATISRVNRCLNYGANGYKIVLGRIYEKDKEQHNGK